MVANVFGRIWALKVKLNIQNRMSSITRSVIQLGNKITRSEKQLNSQKRADINAAKMQNNQQYSMQSASVFLRQSGQYNELFMDDGSFNRDFLATTAGQSLYDSYSKSLSQYSQIGTQTLNETLAQIEDYYDSMYAMQIEPMKDEQTDMETEKAGLQLQLEAANAMEQQEKQFADANLKSMFDNRA